MAIAETVSGQQGFHVIGASMKALENFFEGSGSAKFKSWERISISESIAYGLNKERVESAKNNIRAGNTKIVELGFADVIIFT